MPVLFTCPGCGKNLRIPETTRGKKVRCPACQSVQAVPADLPDSAEGTALPPKTAKTPADRPSPVTARSAPPARSSEAVQAGKLSSADKVTDRPTVKQPPAERDDFEPFQLRVGIVKDPEKKLKRQYAATLASDGLRLVKGKEEVLHVPVGTPTDYVTGSQVAVEIDGRRLELNLFFGWRWYTKRLVRDAAAFLSGERDGLERDDYKMPWYLLLPALPPVGIPIMTLGGAIPAMVGFGLAGTCLGVMQKEEWPVALRIVICLLLSLVGYGAFIGVFFLANR